MDIESKEGEIEEMTSQSVAKSRGMTADGTDKKLTVKKIKKRKKSKTSKSESGRNSKMENMDTKAQEEADFAEEMRIQFRPFDDSTNYEDRPLSRHDRASSRDGKSQPDLMGGNMSSMFSGTDETTNKSNRPTPPPREDGGVSPNGDTFQNISLDDVGKNKEFYQKRPPTTEGAQGADGDTDDYEDDAYEDEFDD